MKKINGIQVKELSDWQGDFIKDFAPGDLVETAIVEQFRDSVPPHRHHADYLQAGEAYDHQEDPRDGKYKATWLTFLALDDKGKIWKFCGACFTNEVQEIQ